MTFGPKMASAGNEKELLMTYDYGIYSFQCKSQVNCYWTEMEHELRINRLNHLMLTVPISLVENCDCDLDSTGDCKCPAGVIGKECDRCRPGYWGFNQDGNPGCKSEFFVSTILDVGRNSGYSLSFFECLYM